MVMCAIDPEMCNRKKITKFDGQRSVPLGQTCTVAADISCACESSVSWLLKKDGQCLQVEIWSCSV